MTGDGDALFRALCANPADDTPRLVYADYLDESGDAARAEFIRLQCERWNLCPAYPTPAAARTRASELLRTYRDRWDAELPHSADVEWGEMYVRGFVDAVRFLRIDDVTATLAAAFGAAPLVRMSVARLKAGQLRELLDCPLLARLQRLSLPGIYGREEARLLIAAQERFPDTEIN